MGPNQNITASLGCARHSFCRILPSPVLLLCCAVPAGKAKAEAERLAAIRAQLLAAAAEKGLSLQDQAAAAEAEKKPKKVRIDWQ